MRTPTLGYVIALSPLLVLSACASSADPSSNTPIEDAGGATPGNASNVAMLEPSSEAEPTPSEEPYVVPTNIECETDPTFVCQFGSETTDFVNAGAVDRAGNVWIAGETRGDIAGTSLGGTDVFLRSYAADGSRVATVQFGDVGEDQGLVLLPDEAGNVWLGGGIASPDGLGGRDAFLRKYDTSGNLLEEITFGTAGSESINSIAADPNGGLWVAGNTSGDFETGEETFGADGFLRRVNADGSLEPAIQFGSVDDDYLGGIAIDGEHNVWVVGCGGDIYQSEDDGTMFVRIYPADGSEPRTLNFFGGAQYIGETYDDCAYAAKTDPMGNVWVTGEAYFKESESMDGFAFRFLPDGTQDDGYRIGTEYDDVANDLTFDGEGNLWVAGTTGGAFPDMEHQGSWDAFVFKFPAAGGDSQYVQFGTDDVDFGEAIGVDGAGHAWVLGHTWGNFGVPKTYSSDAYLRRIEF